MPPSLTCESLYSLSCMQAMELDEMQRDSSDTFALRQQVSAAQQAEAHLRKEVGQLRQQLGAASAAASGGSVDGDGGDFSPRGSVRSIGSAASPSRSVSRMGAVAALQARLDAACRDLSAAQEEVRCRPVEGSAPVAAPGPTCPRVHCPRSPPPFESPTVRATSSSSAAQPSVCCAALQAHPHVNPLSPPPPLLSSLQIARLSADRDRLRDELDARDTEAMRLQVRPCGCSSGCQLAAASTETIRQFLVHLPNLLRPPANGVLQGELSMLQRQMADEQNWLSPLPDPYG